MIDFFISAKRGSRSGHLLERLVSEVFYNMHYVLGITHGLASRNWVWLILDVLTKSSVRL